MPEKENLKAEYWKGRDKFKKGYKYTYFLGCDREIGSIDEDDYLPPNAWLK